MKKRTRRHKAAAKRAPYMLKASTRKTFERFVAWADTQPGGVTFPGLPDGDAAAAELIEFMREALRRLTPSIKPKL